jgi:hypothetical protein
MLGVGYLVVEESFTLAGVAVSEGGASYFIRQSAIPPYPVAKSSGKITKYASDPV